MTLKITEKKDGKFIGRDGNDVPYWWYKATGSDGITRRFGSKNGTLNIGSSYERDIEVTEVAGGALRYRDVTED